MRLLRRRQGPALPRRSHTSTAVAVRGLSKRFGPIAAVDDVSMDVPRGELLALLGPSGCGKTTFLRLIAGFERPDTGTIILGGRTVCDDETFAQPERRRVGIVFQDYALFPHLCVGDNVAFGIRGSTDCDNRVREVLDLVGLRSDARRHPHELSGGQQQRVALARALAPRPDLILLDEPFSNLDATLRRRVRTEVRDILQRAEATAVFVTHDQEEALSLADRVAIMSEGRIHQIATPEVIHTRPDDLFVAAFVGGANMLAGTADGSSVTSALGSFRPLTLPVAGPVTLVIRPESVTLHTSRDGRAVVRSSTYYGHDQDVHVLLESGESLVARTGTSRFYDEGDRVDVSVASDEVLAFPATR